VSKYDTKYGNRRNTFVTNKQRILLIPNNKSG